MKARFPIVFVLLFGLQTTETLPWRHHATATEFDISKTIKLKGVVSKLDWANPHAHVYIDVKGDRGIEQWNVELASPGGIIVSGLSRELLGPGTTLTITGYPAKTNGASKSFSVCATEVTQANGTTARLVVGI